MGIECRMEGGASIKKGLLLDGVSNTNLTLKEGRLLDMRRLFESGRLFDYDYYSLTAPFYQF